ncbi:MAG: hypothetical protein Q8P20_06545 [bacterium]|nr:hypothetical protein [bacterium]
METQPLTPEQQKQIKKTKIKMWIGLVLIIVVGLTIAVYFVFINPIEKDEEVANANSIINQNANVNSIDTSDWLTYESEEYQYSVRVPQGWVINNEGLCGDNRVGFASEMFDCSPDGYSGTYSIIINTGDQSLEEIKTKSPEMNFTDTTINGQPAVQYLYQFNSEYLGGEFTRTGYMLIHGGNTYTIGEELAGQQSGPTEGLVEFAQSLRFFSDWLTYEDKVNGYSVKYPDDYLIKMETDSYVVFDPASIDTPDTTYLHISVNVEDNDFHTYRLGILTNSVVESNSVIEEDVNIDGLSGKKITYKNALGETIIHDIVDYLGKVYDISTTDSVDEGTMDNVLANFSITQLDSSIDITNTTEFMDKVCVSNNECGAYPCYERVCLVQVCTDDSECAVGTCGQYVTPVPGYCTTMDSL